MGDLVKSEDDKLARGQIMQGLTFCADEYAFHPVGTRKPLEDFSWRSDMIVFH